MNISIALEWFMNPDHLPFIAGIHTGAYAQNGLEVTLIEPKEHYDGFETLKNGSIDIHVNEPLHLFEHYFDGIRSLGCFFETRGGVMIRKESIEKLKNNEPITITTPAANNVTNKIGFEILKRYAQKEGFTLDRESVTFVETDFHHLQNMKKFGYDGAWLCFYNFEGVAAEHEGFENLFIDQFLSPYPNFSALELMTTKQVIDAKGEQICTFLKTTGEMAEYLRTHPLEAQAIYYDYTKQERSQLMDKIIIDTLPRLEINIKSDDVRWRALSEFIKELDLVDISEQQYRAIWVQQK